jgi:hypothetical protein
MSSTGNDQPEQEPAAAADRTSSLAYLQRLIDTVPHGPRGVRWLPLPGAVLCQADRDREPPYDDFVSRVDIATVARHFDGVLNSVTDVLHRHPDGRPALQLERVRVRPQAPRRGDAPEVHWLERIEYGADQQRMWIRTVRGCPDVQYDGSVALSRVPGRTRIAFLTRRRLPASGLSALVHRDRCPRLAGFLVERAFRRFVDVTTANIMASYLGERRV